MFCYPIPMQIVELLDELDRYWGPFPRYLIDECIARREEITPVLLEILEELGAHPEAWPEQEGMVHIYAMYLLAYFRETRAYPVLVALFSHPGEAILDLTGDAVLNNGSQMLTSVCGGDLSGIKALIEGEQVNEYVRGLSMEALVFLVIAGRLTRDDVVPYFLELFQKMERRPGYHWDALAMAAVDLWPKETLDELKRAFADGLIGEDVMEWKEIEAALAEGPARAAAPRRRQPFISNMEEDMGWMQAFQSSSPKRPRSAAHQRQRAN